MSKQEWVEVCLALAFMIVVAVVLHGLGLSKGVAVVAAVVLNYTLRNQRASAGGGL
jgi:Flp pilus assembly protein TadB